MSYLNAHPWRAAFLATQLRSLADLISEQGNELLDNAGLSIPSRAVSPVLLIAERGQVSVADIAKELNQPHQLVTQRVEVLLALGLVERLKDPSDQRRKLLILSDKGKQEFLLLEHCLRDAGKVFLALYQEIGCDLPEVAQRVTAALSSRSILSRIKTPDQVTQSESLV